MIFLLDHRKAHSPNELFSSNTNVDNMILPFFYPARYGQVFLFILIQINFVNQDYENVLYRKVKLLSIYTIIFLLVEQNDATS